jgi:serine/threonine protein kinase/tetratricopeptide (TPR) repeat protein
MMSHEPRNDRAGSPDPRGLLLDSICDRFELAFRAGEGPDVFGYVEEALPENRPALLRELIAVAVELELGRAAPANLAGESGTPRDLIAGRYRVLGPHARGNLGVVQVALDTELNREVALKQVRPEHAHDGALRERFLLEGEITGRLEHPGIVPVHSLGTDSEGLPYYTMRLIRGKSLRDAIRGLSETEAEPRSAEHRNLKLRELLRRLLVVCDAVHHAHGRGVIHRDVKPSNIVLGDDGETLLVDWGLAKVLGQSGPDADGPSHSGHMVVSSGSDLAETRAGSVVGTPAYMAPEQAEGRINEVGPWSDVFSLGATLYYILTGRAPRDGIDDDPNPPAQPGDVPRVRRIAPEVPPALEAICLKAMATQPADRYSSARTLAEDVIRWLDDEPVTAWHEPFSTRFRRWGRRHRTAVVAAGVALVAGVIGLSTLATLQAWVNGRLTEANAATTKAKEAAEAALAEKTRAKQATEKALAQSEESRKQAEAIGSFLTETFRSPDPEQDGRKIKVVDVLDRSAAKLEREFAGSDVTRGTLLSVLGQTYIGLGLYDRAEAILKKARDVLKSALGADHQDAIACDNQLAIALTKNGHLREAIDLFEETLKRCEGRFGADHVGALAVRGNLAEAYREAGRLDDAIALAETTLRLREATLPPDHSDILTTRNTLAIAYGQAGRMNESISLLEGTLKQREATLSQDHPDTLTARTNLGSAYLQAKRHVEAIAVIERTLELQEAKLDHDHPRTLTTRGNLAAAYWSMKRLDRSIPLFEETLRQCLAKLGPDHPQTRLTRANLGVNYCEAGQTADGAEMLQQALQGARGRPDEQHLTATFAKTLIPAYESLNRWADAESLWPGELTRYRKVLASDSEYLASALAMFGQNLLRQAKWVEAEPVVRECLVIRTKVLPNQWSRFNSLSMLGRALLGQGRFTEAEPLIIEGYEGMKAREATIPTKARPRLVEAAEDVVRLYEASGQREKLRAWKEKLGLADLPADVFTHP